MAPCTTRDASVPSYWSGPQLAPVEKYAAPWPAETSSPVTVKSAVTCHQLNHAKPAPGRTALRRQ